MNIIKKFWPLLIILGLFFYFFLRGKINDKKFYNQSINSKIIKRSNWAVQTTYFYFDNNLQIDSNSIYNFDLRIGDSIAKSSKTWTFEVFRKNNHNKYEFHKEYNFK